MEVDTSLPSQRVVRMLESIVAERGEPTEIITDNGPDFTSLAMDRWAHENGVVLHFIQPGKPTQDCYVESFNGRFRDECLNENWSANVADARRRIGVELPRSRRLSCWGSRSSRWGIHGRPTRLNTAGRSSPWPSLGDRPRNWPESSSRASRRSETGCSRLRSMRAIEATAPRRPKKTSCEICAARIGVCARSARS
jgi:transposase InsO family protein